MAARTKRRGTASEPDSYFELVRAFPLKAIKTDDQYDRATTVLADLLSDEDLDAGEVDYAEALTELIGVFEDARDKLDTDLRGADALKFLVRTSGMSVTALGKVIGSQGTASEVLAGDREISKGMARKLGDHFKVDYRLFL